MILLYLFSVLLSRWFIYHVYLNTQWFSGPDQFLILLLFYFTWDLYLMMYCPYKWIRKSVEANWIGWSDGRLDKPGHYFYFVRKPDPQEELRRKGYFKKPSHHHHTSMARISERIQRGRALFCVPAIETL